MSDASPPSSPKPASSRRPRLRDERVRDESFLNDKALFDFLTEEVRNWAKNDADAQDLRQGAYIVALTLVKEGRGPFVGAHPYAWMKQVLEHHALNTKRKLRVQRKREPLFPSGEVPDLPAEDVRELAEAQRETEARLGFAEEFMADHPEVAEAFAPEDGRSTGKGAVPSAVRARRFRIREKLVQEARKAFALVSSALLGALLVLFLVFFVRRDRGPTLRPDLPRTPDTTLAATMRTRAFSYCDTKAWEPCLTMLREAARLDPHVAEDPRAIKARTDALTALRDDALTSCDLAEWTPCLDELDLAKRFDPDGDATNRIAIAREQANRALRQGGGTQKPSDVKKGP